MGSQKGLGLYRNVYVYDQDQDLLDWVHKTSEAPEQHLKSTLYIKKLQYVGVNKQSLWWQMQQIKFMTKLQMFYLFRLLGILANI